MEKIGLRELKNRLSHYVRRVRTGHPIQVTDRGEVVAELLPPAHSVASVKRLLDEERGER
jgi:prevent-host-death family protein